MMTQLNKKSLTKRILPHFIAAAIFLMLVLVYFFPLVEGKMLYQGDIVNYTGMSHEIVKFRDQTGIDPKWTNAMFSGMPAFQITVLYPSNLVRYFDQLFQLWLPHPANYIFLMLAGFYFLLITLKVDWRLSIAGAIAFAFSSYSFIIIETGHNSKAHAIAYIAPVIASILMTYRGKFVLGAALTALFLSLQLYTNHLQITYYLLLSLLVLGVVKFIFSIIQHHVADFAKATGLLIIAAGIAVLPNITSLWATYQYGQYTMRGKSELSEKKQSSGLDKDYAMSWSYGVAESFTVLIPNFMGGASQTSLTKESHSYKAMEENNVPKKNALQLVQNLPTYWGAQPFTSGPVYLGSIVCFLFVLGLFIVKGPEKWWLLVIALLSFMLAWGKNFPMFTDLFFDYFPGYNKFRAVSMTLVIAQFTFPILGFLALRNILGDKYIADQTKTRFYIALGITGGLTLIFALMPGMFFDFSSSSDEQLKTYGYPDWLIDALYDDRKSMLQKDAFRSLVFILLTSGLIFLHIKQKLKTEIIYVLIAALVLVDMWQVDKRYLNDENFASKSKVNAPFTPSEVDKQILTDKDINYRVLNLAKNTFNDANTSYFHKSIGGYHGAKLKRYQELIDYQISKNNLAVLNMLNTKYIIMKGKENPESLYPNPEALGNAWFVKEYKMVANADSEITALTGFEPAKTAIIDKRFEGNLKGFSFSEDSAASIVLTDYMPHQLTYQSESKVEQLTVFSEIYYDKGWNAYIDGQLKPHFRVNYVLRAMIVPAGKHTIEYKFEPQVYATGEKISLAGSCLLLLVVAGGLGMELRRKKVGANL